MGTKKFFCSVLFLSLVFFISSSVSSYADSSRYYPDFGPDSDQPIHRSQHAAPKEKSASSQSTLDLNLSVSEGYASLATQSSTLNSSGAFTQALALLDWHLGSWTMELGGGLMTTTLSGGSPSTAITTSSNLSLVNYSSTTNAGVVQISPLYRVSDHIEVGPMGQILIGQDVGFLPSIGYSGQSTAFFGGAQGLYEIPFESFHLKTGLQYISSLNLYQERLQSVQATLQIGFSLL